MVILCLLVQNLVRLMMERLLTPAHWTQTDVRAATELRLKTSSKTLGLWVYVFFCIFFVNLHQLALLPLLVLMCRCCNTCDDVREAYRRRGWAFKSADTIEQCKREGFTQKMQEQKNEGCQVYGFLEVNKVF